MSQNFQERVIEQAIGEIAMSQDKELKKLFGKSEKTDFLRAWYYGSRKKIKDLWWKNLCHLDQIYVRDDILTDRDEALEVLTRSQAELISAVEMLQEKVSNLIKENESLKLLLKNKKNLERVA
ncbi:MAG: hypothetical protein L6Q54_11475 [Leptospiraceae bacterium]|nr:hypothetical protein [Leptospiraceae bacterium]MCK6381848.1 hypothetical protein [Leptospiraceae bacterium]NUM42925.1 hypothetical protein [Leptospiraceae bacterium]